MTAKLRRAEQRNGQLQGRLIVCEITPAPFILETHPDLGWRVRQPMGNTVFIATFALFSLGRLTGFFTDPHLSADDIHAIVGSPAAVAGPAVLPQRLNVVSWNIERGVRFEGVLETLRKLDADVLLLQEVDRYCDRSGGRDVAAELAAALGMNWIAAGEFQEIGEATKGRAALHGQAILSRYPITDAGVLVFAEQARWRWRLNPVQPRRGGRMALKARTGGMLVYTAHLESGGNDTLRRKQLDEMVRDQQREARPGSRTDRHRRRFQQPAHGRLVEFVPRIPRIPPINVRCDHGGKFCRLARRHTAPHVDQQLSI